MDSGTILTAVGTVLATVGLVYGFLRNFKNDINAHIDRIDQNMITQSKRTDHLYQICIDLLRRDKT